MICTSSRSMRSSGLGRSGVSPTLSPLRSRNWTLFHSSRQQRNSENSWRVGSPSRSRVAAVPAGSPPCCTLCDSTLGTITQRKRVYREVGHGRGLLIHIVMIPTWSVMVQQSQKSYRLGRDLLPNSRAKNCPDRIDGVRGYECSQPLSCDCCPNIAGSDHARKRH